MKKHHLIIIGIAITSFISCQKKIAKNSDSTTKTNTIKNVIIDTQTDISNTGANYAIDSLKINGDVLSVFVNYSGGCKTHSFDLVSNGMYAKSLPPQLTLCLRHTANDDNCRKLVMEELKFNIAKAQSPGSKKLLIKLGDKQVMYQSK